MTFPASTLRHLATGTLLLGIGSVSMLSQAAVTLLIDDNVKVTAINGQEVKRGIFEAPTTELTLQPGQHVITAKYDRLYKLPRDEHDYLRSGNISVAAQLADNQTYRLTMPNQPEKYEAAKEYAERPTLAIQQGDTIIASQQSIAGNDGGLFAGLGKALGNVFGGSDSAEIQNQRAIAALDQPAIQSAQTGVATQSNNAQVNAASLNTRNSVSSVTPTYRAIAPIATTRPAVNTSTTINTTNATNTSSTLDNFMQLWLQATPSEREKIRQWVQP